MRTTTHPATVKSTIVEAIRDFFEPMAVLFQVAVSLLRGRR